MSHDSIADIDTAYVRRGLELAGLTAAGTITRFGMPASGGRGNNRRVPWKTGSILVHPDASDEACENMARLLSVLPDWALSLCRQLDQTRAELDRVAPKKRSLLGTGCVRVDADGSLWLLSSAEKGWASFGFKVADWDELFRRFNVRIGAPQVDVTGQWWPAEAP